MTLPLLLVNPLDPSIPSWAAVLGFAVLAGGTLVLLKYVFAQSSKPAANGENTMMQEVLAIPPTKLQERLVLQVPPHSQVLIQDRRDGKFRQVRKPQTFVVDGLIPIKWLRRDRGQKTFKVPVNQIRFRSTDATTSQA